MRIPALLRLPPRRLLALAFPWFVACSPKGDEKPVIGLITKTASNPFFVKMKEGAEQAAAAQGATLIAAAGRSDGDNAGQVTAIENLMAAGAKAILISASDSKAIVPAIKKARDAGILVIALDSPTDPVDATDALFATDNYKAGQLIGKTDANGRNVEDGNALPQDLNATIGAACGLPIEKEFKSDTGRPFLIADKGKVIPGVLS